VYVVKIRGPVGNFKGRGLVNGKLAAECEFSAMKADNPQ